MYKIILVHHGRPTLKQQKSGYFPHESESKHIARPVKANLNSKRLPAIDVSRPALSMYLNTIQSSWNVIELNLRSEGKSRLILEDPFQHLTIAWNNTPKKLNNIVHFMPSRCNAVIDS